MQAQNWPYSSRSTPCQMALLVALEEEEAVVVVAAGSVHLAWAAGVAVAEGLEDVPWEGTTFLAQEEP